MRELLEMMPEGSPFAFAGGRTRAEWKDEAVPATEWEEQGNASPLWDRASCGDGGQSDGQRERHPQEGESFLPSAVGLPRAIRRGAPPCLWAGDGVGPSFRMSVLSVHYRRIFLWNVPSHAGKALWRGWLFYKYAAAIFYIK